MSIESNTETLSIHNGKTWVTELRSLDRRLFKTRGYYRGLIYDAHMVKDALRAAKGFIEKNRVTCLNL